MGLCKRRPWAIEQKELEDKGYKFNEKGECIFDPKNTVVKEPSKPKETLGKKPAKKEQKKSILSKLTGKKKRGK